MTLDIWAPALTELQLLCTLHEVKLGPGGPAHKAKAAIAAGTLPASLPAARVTLLRNQMPEEHVRWLSRHIQVSEIVWDDPAREAMAAMRSDIVSALASVYGFQPPEVDQRVPQIAALHAASAGDDTDEP